MEKGVIVKSDYDFDPAVIVGSAKPHRCFACGWDMPVGTPMIEYKSIRDGKFRSFKICVECGYLISFQTGDHAGIIKEGCFTDQRIPNCLRKKRTEFRKNPKAAIQAAGLDKVLPPEPPKPVTNIVVKVAEWGRRMFFIRKMPRWSLEHFPVGQHLTLQAGVNGEKREVVIKNRHYVAGRNLHRKGKFIGLLTA